MSNASDKAEPLCNEALAKRMLDRLWGLLDGVGGPPRAIDLQRAINEVLATLAPRVDLKQAEKVKAALVYSAQGGPWTAADLCKALNAELAEHDCYERTEQQVTEQSREHRALHVLVRGLCGAWNDPSVRHIAAEAMKILEGHDRNARNDRRRCSGAWLER